VTVPAPPPPPPPTPAAVRFCNKPAILMINFDVDKYNIKPQYHAELKTVGDFLKEFPTSHGDIAGHTDSTHTRAYNQKLSERRANSVKEYIIKNFGIAPERLTSSGYGEDKPIATNKTKAGRAKNRRIVANFVCD
jgi:OOP family OmpA-OmpF porin